MGNHGLLVLGMQECFNTHKESLRTQVCQLPKSREHSLCFAQGAVWTFKIACSYAK